MRITIIILLLFSLGVPFWGTYTVLHSEKESVKAAFQEQLREGTDESELVLLTFARSEINAKLRWEHDREFEYRGQMYDLVESTAAGDSVRYLCYWDKEETRLNRKLEQLVAWLIPIDAQEEGTGYRLLLLKPLFYQDLTHWTAFLRSWYLPRARYCFVTLPFVRIMLSPPFLPPDL